MKKIVFICTGNVCRSPMAEHYMQGKIKELKKMKNILLILVVYMLILVKKLLKMPLKL